MSELARTTKYKNYQRLNRYTKDGEFNCVLSFSTANDNPRVGVNYGKKAEGGKYTYGGFDYYTFTGFLQSVLIDLDNYLSASKDQPRELTERVCTCSYMRDGVKTVVGGLKFGVNKEGLVYLSYTAKDFPSIEFPYAKSEWHTLKVRDDSAWKEEAETKISAAFALRHLTLLQQVLTRDFEDRVMSEADSTTSIITAPVKEEPPKPKQVTKEAEMPEDDVPF